MAVTGDLKFQEDERASWFSHKAEEAKPYYYKTYLADYDVTAEVAPTERAAMFRFTFPENDNSYIVLDAFDKGSMVKIIQRKEKLLVIVKIIMEEFLKIFIIILWQFLIKILN
jgi:putative alpha-1,2-mannosidase